MIALGEVLKKSAEFLEKKGLSNARREAEEVLAYCLRKSRMDLYLDFERPMDEKELIQVRENLQRRAKREPLQYIEGEVSFYNAKFKVGPGVLIPRHETEILVDEIAQTLKQEDLNGKVLWDVGTGSGCIGISLKKLFPELRVIVSDLSSDALKRAEENAKLNQVEVECYLGDLLEAQTTPVDYLVSNPPYISEQAYLSLEAEVREYEPKTSLVSGKTGLEIYERFAKGLRKILKKPAKVWFEIGYDQKESLKKIFEEEKFSNFYFKKDFAGLDRFFFLELE